MKLKSFLKFENPNSQKSKLIAFLSIERDAQGDNWVVTYQIEKKYFHIFVRELSKNKLPFIFPKIFVTKQKINTTQLESFIKFTKQHFDDNDLDSINSYLSHKAVIRGNDGFRLVTADGLEKINNLIPREPFIAGSNDLFLDTNGIKKLSFKMFNVGQANCSCLIANGKPIAIFDLGCQRINPELSNTIDFFNNGNIFISHFDNDHINFGKRLFKKDHANIRIFYPALQDLDSLSISAKIFLVGLSFTKYELCPVVLYKNEIIDLGIVKIFQGVDVGKNYNSSLSNSKCLIALIKNKKSILVPGDALYKNFPISYKPNYLIIPHHGCKLDPDAYLTNIDISNLEEAFVFCGPNRKYKHANLTHLKHFSDCKIKRFRRTHNQYDGNEIFNGNATIERKDDFTELEDGFSTIWHI